RGRAPRRGRSRGGAFQDVYAAGGTEADEACEPDLGVGNLPVTGLAAQLRRDLEDVGDTGRADGVALGEEATGDVDRRTAVAPRCARVDELARATRLAEPQVVVVDEL